MNIRAVAEKTGMDYEKALDGFCGDVSSLSALLSSFKEYHFERLGNAVAAKDTDAVRTEARALRKLSEKLAFDEIAKACRTLEEASEEKIESDYSHVDSCCRKVLSILSEEGTC